MNNPDVGAARWAEGCKSRRALHIFWLVCLLCTEATALDRNAFTFTRYDLHARVVPAEQAFEVEGRITLRNDSPTPQRSLSLQVSSTLAWQSIRIAGKPLTYVSQPYTTDIDHTGKVTEAIATLPADVQPKARVELEIAYGGTIPADAGRLERIGAPQKQALASDWDQISDAFTAVRGVGYVCWYPVAMDAASLSEGATLFQTLGAWKARHAASEMRLTLALESEKLVVTNGRLVGQKARAEAEGTLHEREYEFAPMGLAPSTFAMADFTLLGRPAINVFHLPRNGAGAQEYALAAEKLLPFFTDWFGPQREKIAIVELPEGDAPFASGTMLFTPLIASDRKGVEVAVANPLAHAFIASPRPWIAEGVPHFAQALVRERQDGRKAALAFMQTFRPALVETEKQAQSGKSPTLPLRSAQDQGQDGAPEGQPLVRATDEVYYRAKAMFVWWMLRDIVGDPALERALQAYRAADDKEPAYVQRLVEAQAKRRLEWFFDDWVYRDRGLPDFRIVSAYARQSLAENVSVTVTVENSGGAGAEVPVLAPAQGREGVERVLVPARGRGVARVPAPATPGEVIVNDGSVPESDMSNNTFKLAKPQ